MLIWISEWPDAFNGSVTVARIRADVMIVTWLMTTFNGRVKSVFQTLRQNKR